MSEVVENKENIEVKSNSLQVKDREKELAQKEKKLAEREEMLKKLSDELTSRQKAFEIQKDEAKKLLEDAELLENNLRQKENDIDEKVKQLDYLNSLKETLDQKSQQIDKDRQEFEQQKQEFELEQLEKRKNFEIELARIRTQKIGEMHQSLAQDSKNMLENIRKNWEDFYNNKFNEELAKLDEDIKAKQSLIDKEKVDLSKKLQKQVEEKGQIAALKTELKIKEQELKEQTDTFDDIVNEKVKQLVAKKEEEIASLNSRLSVAEKEREDKVKLLSQFEILRNQLGSDPQSIATKISSYESDIASLRQDLATRPSKNLQEQYDTLKEKYDELDSQIANVQLEKETINQEKLNLQTLQAEKMELAENNKFLQQQYTAIETVNQTLEAELKRIQSGFGALADREERIKSILDPVFKIDVATKITPFDKGDNEKQIHELAWLDKIYENLVDYGFKFPKRLLKSFHTSLKTGEWSPITVLAGVSGTGKSELPRLYSLFGGINFLNLSVQPCWDSQESMLGYFNAIDNYFDAQPVLRFLAQSQIVNNENYPYGLRNTVNIVLLDEMNLAHVELYFAEFLSQFEQRRGRGKNNLPKLPVKLGSGITPYEIDLGRNMLWVGTMNQDETTKSLSDKVIDRGIVIHFPRPDKLQRRSLNKALPSEPRVLLNYENWQNWITYKNLISEEFVNPYKDIIEEINNCLGKCGRALGHRVWQSVEAYMNNYPDIRKILCSGELDIEKKNQLNKFLHVAFEDQLVQKVMPKLRGIETSGMAKSECLDKIRAILDSEDFSIIEDYDNACKLGYGQFMWNSANYLNKEETVETEEKNSN